VNIAVVIATVGRPATVLTLTRSLLAQTVVPRQVIVAAPREIDTVGCAEVSSRVVVVTGPSGASAQRNAALTQVEADVDVVIFLDDDTIPRGDYLEEAGKVFATLPAVVGLTGTLLRDGAAEGGQVPLDEAHDALLSSCSAEPTEPTHVNSLYGCNAAVRWSAASDLRFDEALPLYSWLEDLDYSRQLATAGELIHVRSCIAVHQGAASGGRQQHTRFGYSQVTNPAYLMKKGTVSPRQGLTLIIRPLLKNAQESIFGPSWRRARLRGNLLSLADLARLRLTPGRILEF
jgi:GT2 family glycosyltransferase